MKLGFFKEDQIFSNTVFTDGRRREINEYKKHFKKIKKRESIAKKRGKTEVKPQRFKPTIANGLSNEQVETMTDAMCFDHDLTMEIGSISGIIATEQANEKKAVEIATELLKDGDSIDKVVRVSKLSNAKVIKLKEYLQVSK